MKKYLSDSSGFTLVELMVVVAIIGILSAIAVPNFKKYQAKSKQSEAKIQLAAVYSTEVAANADYDTYATCLGVLGYETPPKGYYIAGFPTADATTAGVVNGRTQPGYCAATNAIAPTQHLKVDSAALPAAADLTGTSVSSTAFTAAAAGDISGSGAAFDKWTINDSKNLVNAFTGY